MEISHGRKENTISLFARIGRFSVAPRRQFRRLLVVVFVIFVLSVAFHGYVLYRIHTHKLFFLSADVPVELPRVDEAKVQSVLSEYEGKQLRKNAAVTVLPPATLPNK